MDALHVHVAFLAEHVVAVVFCAFLIEAAGIPFPSRIILIVAAASRFDLQGLIELGLAATGGAAIGDHVPYLGGMLAGPRLLTFYCRITLGSERCVERTLAYFRRFGAAAILLSRFSASVRLFASVLSGCGHITYTRFVLYDVAGTLIYTAVWVVVGRVVGEHAGDLLQRHGVRLLMLVGPCALVCLLGYRLWRRRRYGVAQAEVLIRSLPAECAPPEGSARSA
jgi:membrane protein DedA with SNARE-associated domain